MNLDFFGGLAPRFTDNSMYVARRKELVDAIKNEFPQKTGSIVLFANFESESERFRQDKTFFYYTGINEPGVMARIDLSGRCTLYIPNYLQKRSQWMNVSESLMKKDAKKLEVDAIEFLGEETEGYTFYPHFSEAEYTYALSFLKEHVQNGATLFATFSPRRFEQSTTHLLCEYMERYIPNILQSICDISPLVARARQRKDVGEIEKIYRAIEITELAHESAIQMIKTGTSESEVQASLEYMMIASHARPAFPSIVASGKNSTVLHYNENSGTLKNGDVVVIDIGAELHNYCADLTRTYPVSGSFTPRQKELYKIVLDTQEYIADQARPGMWLKNKDKVDQSLHHLAVKFLQKQGYDKYFPHGIGHFLGLNVHDVGDYSMPLQEGDVITIEPGIYIPEEGIGIRIEDNYWITKDGAMCLSENLPKEIDHIEEIVQQALEDNAKEQSTDADDWIEEDDYDDEDEDYN